MLSGVFGVSDLSLLFWGSGSGLGWVLFLDVLPRICFSSFHSFRFWDGSMGLGDFASVFRIWCLRFGTSLLNI